VEAIAFILQTKVNLASHLTAWSCTSSLENKRAAVNHKGMNPWAGCQWTETSRSRVNVYWCAFAGHFSRWCHVSITEYSHAGANVKIYRGRHLLDYEVSRAPAIRSRRPCNNDRINWEITPQPPKRQPFHWWIPQGQCGSRNSYGTNFS